MRLELAQEQPQHARSTPLPSTSCRLGIGFDASVFQLIGARAGPGETVCTYFELFFRQAASEQTHLSCWTGESQRRNEMQQSDGHRVESIAEVLWFERSDVRQIPVFVAIIESVANHELVWDLEPNQVRFQFNLLPTGLAQQHSGANRTWAQ